MTRNRETFSFLKTKGQRIFDGRRIASIINRVPLDGSRGSEMHGAPIDRLILVPE